jgi:hypothetical protein
VAQKTRTKSGGLRRASTKSLKKATSRRAKANSEKIEDSMLGISGEEVTIDRRRTDRRDNAPESTSEAGATQLERRKKVNRRRQIDPTTCERDYTDQEVEFMNALDDYKRKSGRMFPTCSEVLEVLRGIGYVKLSTSELGAMGIDRSPSASAKPMPTDWQAGSETSESTSDERFA